MFKRLLAPLCALASLSGAVLYPALSTPAHAGVSLVGAGSTFDFPFFDKAFKAYQSTNGVSINYQPVGSGAGIQQFTQKLVDFGASDVPMSPLTELRAAVKVGGPVEQIPVALGGISIAYNVPGLKTGLHLNGPTIARIFLGTITKWNDRAIKHLNPRTRLPNLGITVVHRSDASGTSYGFSDYLSVVDSQWRGLVGASKTPAWPTGVGGAGNLGVAQLVLQTKGAIGYVELAYVLQAHMHEAMVENAKGQFLFPTIKSVATDAASFKRVSATTFSISNGKVKNAYPISTYSWLLIYQHQPDAAKGKALVKLMKWLVTTAQSKYAKHLDYVPLPRNVQSIAVSDLKKVRA